MAAAILTQCARDIALHVRATPFSGPIAWTRDTIAPEESVLRLEPECCRELAGALRTIRDNPLPVLMLEPSAFELRACRALMARARRMLAAGTGFVLIDRLPLDDYTVDEAKALYCVLAQLLARPVAQSWDGKMIYDVRDLGRLPGNGVRPDITNAEQSFHTDNSYNLCPPEYVCLLCLHPAKEGGISRVVSFATAHNAMLTSHARLLPRLYRPFLFDRQRGQIQIIDNRRLGHCRTGFSDFPEPERKRHLVRLWLRDAARRFYNG